MNHRVPFALTSGRSGASSVSTAACIQAPATPRVRDAKSLVTREPAEVLPACAGTTGTGHGCQCRMFMHSALGVDVPTCRQGRAPRARQDLGGAMWPPDSWGLPTRTKAEGSQLRTSNLNVRAPVQRAAYLYLMGWRLTGLIGTTSAS
jgi:hypothetical protein